MVNCTICLDTRETQNRCVINDCMHQFCLECIRQWLVESGLCPLCQSKIQSILHNIKSDTDFEEEPIDQDRYINFGSDNNSDTPIDTSNDELEMSSDEFEAASDVDIDNTFNNAIIDLDSSSPINITIFSSGDNNEIDDDMVSIASLSSNSDSNESFQSGLSSQHIYNTNSSSSSSSTSDSESTSCSE